MKRASFVGALCAVLFVAPTFAAKKFDRDSRSRATNDWSFQLANLLNAGDGVPRVGSGFQSSAASGSSGSSLIVGSPGTPDNWNGGSGNWSNPANWSAGLPTNSSDVIIHSGGNDDVLLNTSASISSLTLGGQTGSAVLNATTAQSLVIAGPLTILPSSGEAAIYLSNGYSMTANADSVNSLVIELSGASLTINANFTSYDLDTVGSANKITILGTLTNNANFSLQGTSDVANVGSLINNGAIEIGSGAALNLTNQPDGITDVATGTAYLISGTFTAGGNNAFAQLTTVGGDLFLSNGQITNVTPQGGTFTVAPYNGPGGGDLRILNGATLQINGNMNNYGDVIIEGAPGGNLTVTGVLTNEQANTGYFAVHIGTVNVGTLVNNGLLYVDGPDATLNLTNQPGGITDVVANSVFYIEGTFTAGGNNAFAHLTSVEGEVDMGTGQTINVTPLGGTLTLAGGSLLGTGAGTTLQINGDVNNFGMIDDTCCIGSGPNIMTITGSLTNNLGGQVNLLRLTGSDTLSALTGLSNNGSIAVSNGSSINTPMLDNGGTVSVDTLSKLVVGMGSPIGSGYIQLANGTLGERISVTNFGVINVNGSALLAGTLDILLQGGFNPAVGTPYKFLLFNPGQLTGTFDNIENDVFNGGTEKWLVDYDSADGYVELIAENNGTPIPEPSTLPMLVPGLIGVAYGVRRMCH